MADETNQPVDPDQKPPVDPSEVAAWPLWRIALKNFMELPNFGFGMQVEAKWFEQQLDEKLDTTEFAFAMMDIAKHLEWELGYVLQRATVLHEDSGLTKTFYKISSEGDHTEILGPRHNDKAINHTRRCLNIISKTLVNPKAKLTDAQRASADKEMQISAQRLLFMRRQQSFIKTIKAHNPKLLKGDAKKPDPNDPPDEELGTAPVPK